ncbi:hypothetical protein KU43P_35610 [Pseudomonas sp. KU43P]|nr:hypothetical protein KU43P_35610 [Pseudomonas sp. KU43P]
MISSGLSNRSTLRAAHWYGWPTGLRLSVPAREAERAQVEFVDEDVDHAHWVFIGNVFVQALRQQCNLRPSLALDESLHDCPHHDLYDQKVRQSQAFSHSLDRELPAPHSWA